MPVVTAGLYKLTLSMTRADQTLRNVFYYLDDDDDDNSEQELNTGFQVDVLPSILQLLVEAVIGDNIEVESVFGIGAPDVDPITSETGGLVGSSAPTFTAAPFKYFRTTRETRNGSKRIGPMRDEDILGDFFDPTYFQQMEDTAGALSFPVTSGPKTFRPVIASRPDVMPAPSWTVNLVQTVQAVDRVTTQNTRKRGRGE